MPCNPEELRHVPLFALLDDEEIAILAKQVEMKKFAPRQRIYKMGEPGGRAYILMDGGVKVTMVDEDQQEVVVMSPATASSSALRRCWSRRRIRRRPSPRKIPRALRSIATTLRHCWRVSR